MGKPPRWAAFWRSVCLLALALEDMSFHQRMRKSPKQASLCSKKIFSSGSVPFFTLEELKLTQRRIQKSPNTSQLPPGLMGQDREARSVHTAGTSVCICVQACVCLHGRGWRGTWWGDFSPFLFLVSSFVTFCCVIPFWGERLPELGFPDSLLMTEPFSLGDLLEVTIATG